MTKSCTLKKKKIITNIIDTSTNYTNYQCDQSHHGQLGFYTVVSKYIEKYPLLNLNKM